MDHGRYSYNLYIIPISDNKRKKLAYNNNPIGLIGKCLEVSVVLAISI